MWRCVGLIGALLVGAACGSDNSPAATDDVTARTQPAPTVAPSSTAAAAPTTPAAPTRPAAPTSAPSSTAAPAAAPAALDFSAPTVDGQTLDLNTYAGKNVAFWFWAPF